MSSWVREEMEREGDKEVATDPIVWFHGGLIDKDEEERGEVIVLVNSVLKHVPYRNDP